MTDYGGADVAFRGKRLHPEMGRRVVGRYSTGHYEDAVLAAFKVIETRLRDITGNANARTMDLLHETLNPATGTLQDPNAWPTEREGLYNFFRSAFLAFRDRRAHEFVDTNAEEAFDLIVLANRMLTVINRGQQSPEPQPTNRYISYDQLPSYLNAFRSVYQDEMYGLGEGDGLEAVFLDADNDGEPELLVPGHQRGDVPLRVFKNVRGRSQQIEVEPVEKSFFPRDIALADVDNEGQQEVVCVGYGAYNNVLRFYKYRDGRYEVLKKAAQDAETTHTDTKDFLAAHVADINDDDQVEVISQPKPLGRIPPQNRYVWKWSEEQGVFRLLYEESLA